MFGSIIFHHTFTLFFKTNLLPAANNKIIGIFITPTSGATLDTKDATVTLPLVTERNTKLI